MTETMFPTTTDPEVALVGAMMLLPASEAAQLVDAVDAQDLRSPYVAAIWTAITDLASRGEYPDPVSVFGQIRHGGAIEANKLQILQQTITAAVERCPHPFAARHYAALVIEESYRRTVEQLGERLAQIAHTSGIDDLDATMREALDRLRDARSRLTTANPALAGGAL